MEERQPHILAIDDDRNLLRILESVLAHEGFSVSVCDNGVEGLRMAEAEEPDLVILDVSMPGMSGIEVMREMRANPVTGDIPILFLSAVDDEATVVKGLKGGDDYMLKPLKSLELEARIRKILDRAGAGEKRPGVPVLEDRIPVRIQKETYLFPLEEIYYLQASGRYSYIHLKDRRHLTDYSISELDARLGENPRFLRVHRSFIVNADHVHKITRDERGRTVVVVATEPRAHIRVSESYLDEVKKKLGV